MARAGDHGDDISPEVASERGCTAGPNTGRLTTENIPKIARVAASQASCWYMSSELDLPEERHTTLLARERLEVLVLATVRDEVGGLPERLAALRALVRLLARVNVRVLLHVGLLVEALAAELVVERARV